MKTKLKSVLHLYLGGKCKYSRPSSFNVETIDLSMLKHLSETGSYDLCKPILRPISDITKTERSEMFNLVFGRYFPDNGGVVFIDKETTLQQPRWVLSSGLDRLGIQINGEVWYDCDLNPYKFNQHLITLFYLEKGFDIFGLIQSDQAIDGSVIDKII